MNLTATARACCAVAPPDWPSIAVVERDLLRLYRQGRQRHRYAASGKGNTRALHEWRKRVKDLRYAAEMLGLRPLARRADGWENISARSTTSHCFKHGFQRPAMRRSKANEQSKRARPC